MIATSEEIRQAKSGFTASPWYPASLAASILESATRNSSLRSRANENAIGNYVYSHAVGVPREEGYGADSCDVAFARCGGHVAACALIGVEPSTSLDRLRSKGHRSCAIVTDQGQRKQKTRVSPIRVAKKAFAHRASWDFLRYAVRLESVRLRAATGHAPAA